MHRFTAVLAAALLFAEAAGAGADEQSSQADTSDARMERWMAHPQRTAHARRAETPPRLDGVIDEEIWLRAPVNEGFTQSDPDHGEPASLRTTFQVAYDDDALYIAGICYDHPDSVSGASGAARRVARARLLRGQPRPPPRPSDGGLVHRGPFGLVQRRDPLQ